MAGQASISTEILARYAAEQRGKWTACEGRGQSAAPTERRAVSGENGAVRVELHLVTEWGASIPAVGPRVQERVREYLRNMADVEPAAVEVVVDAVGPENMSTRISGLTGATLETAPRRLPRMHLVADTERPQRRQAQVDPRGRGRVGRLGDGLLRRRRAAARLDAVRAGGALPACARAARRARERRRRSRVTCAYLTDPSRPWVMQSLFLTAIGDARERGAHALEAFAYRYPEGETT